MSTRVPKLTPVVITSIHRPPPRPYSTLMRVVLCFYRTNNTIMFHEKHFSGANEASNVNFISQKSRGTRAKFIQFPTYYQKIKPEKHDVYEMYDIHTTDQRTQPPSKHSQQHFPTRKSSSRHPSIHLAAAFGDIFEPLIGCVIKSEFYELRSLLSMLIRNKLKKFNMKISSYFRLVFLIVSSSTKITFLPPFRGFRREE